MLGPWIKQHDADFLPDGSISVFGNDTIDTPWRFELHHLRNGHSDIYVVLPDGEIETPYTDVMARYDIGTETEGLADILENGDAFIEETMRGRLSRISRDGLVWTYYNADDSRAGVLNWSRYYPAGALPEGATRPCSSAERVAAQPHD